MMRAPTSWRLVQLAQSSKLFCSSSVNCSRVAMLTTQLSSCSSIRSASTNKFVPCRFYHVTANRWKREDQPASQSKLEEIRLFSSQDEDLGVMPKSRAKLIADAEDLKLVRILTDEQSESDIPLYKIMGGKEISQWRKQEKEVKKQLKPKSRKTLKINSSITENDLNIKTRHAVELLTKGHEIKVIIKNASKESKGMSSVFQHLTDACKELAIVKQAQQSPRDLVFLLRPKDIDDEGGSSDVKKLKPLKFEEMK